MKFDVVVTYGMMDWNIVFNHRAYYYFQGVDFTYLLDDMIKNELLEVAIASHKEESNG